MAASPNGAARVAPGEPLVRVERVTRVIATRAQRSLILDDVSFDVPARSLFAINGPSGSGKSTVLNMLTGLDRPTQGRVIFGGEELRAKSENALARWRGRHVGIVFQFFQLIPTLTAAENVMLALQLGGGGKRSAAPPSRSEEGGVPRRLWRRHALECLNLVDVAKYADRLPSELSGGQQQRVAIARALANDPLVLVADEPTGNLDSQSAHAVFHTLAALTRRGKTVIYVTHDPQLAARATAGIELLDGRVVARHDAQAASASGHDGAETEAAR